MLCARFPGEYWRELGSSDGPTLRHLCEALTEARLSRRADPREAMAGWVWASPRPASSWKRSTAPAAMPPPAMPRCTPWARWFGTAARSRSGAGCRSIAAGELRLQAFSVTEPEAGSDTTASHVRHRSDGD